MNQNDNFKNAIFIENDNSFDDNFDVREKLNKYLHHWYLIFFSIIISISVGFLFIQFQTEQFSVLTTIFIDDEEKGGLSTEMTAFEDLGISTGNKTSIINEIGVIKSKTLTKKVIEKLNFNIFYYKKGRFIKYEIYKNEVPFELIHLNKNDSLFNEIDTTFSVIIKSKSNFIIKQEDGGIQENVFNKEFYYGFGLLQLNAKKNIDEFIGDEIFISISSIRTVLNSYNDRLSVEPQDKKSSLLDISLQDPSKAKAKDFLNSLVEQYNQDAIDYKNILSTSTDEFINNRIIDISLELSNVDKGVEEYKRGNQLTDMEAEAGLILESNSQLGKKIIDLNSQLKLINYVLEYLRSNPNELIPANLGIQDGKTVESTILYNKLLLERNRIIKGSSNINPTVVNIDDQLNTLRVVIEQGLVNYKSSISFSLNEAKTEENRLNYRRALAPKQEREFQDIKRQQQIIETLYLYLLQKREENAISIGMPVPNARIIDKAYGENSPVAPRKRIIIILFFLVGVLIPTTFIYFRSVLDNKVHSIEDIEKFIDAPIIGEIPKNEAKRLKFISDKDVTGFAESFRLVRTNLNYISPKKENKCQTFLMTSTIPGEGKSSTSINLANVLSSINQKVLLIETDLRKPKLSKYLNQKDKIGLSNYLVDESYELSDVVKKAKSDSFDYIPVGVIPPNPTSLLLNQRMEKLIILCQNEYDYIIFDAPPVTAVTDALLLSKYSSLVIFVIRANFLDKKLLKVAMNLKKNQFKNMAILFNASDNKKRGYTYGYESQDQKKKWYSF